VAQGYSRGTVIDVDIPRLDGRGVWKERPVLIISTDGFHHTRPQDLLVALITHRVWKYNGPTELFIQDWQLAGLTVPSVVRSSIYLITRSQVKSVRGNLSQRDLRPFEACLRIALGV